ncbi:hypothetical protein PHACT_07785 [Pseudohongiella acticola]|jgi:hypothetical protein|uniref:Uncharacterized protein n=1 Tax=Pseudohongiella acticola TaxID=1524254 RepID=A0A1E8CKT6_9GAMM|nr:hypothetical protein [Pseudohongiella acticola]OFE13049.1 hypothetical protein PHACT_07785 [Pseudohongiella acticola]
MLMRKMELPQRYNERTLSEMRDVFPQCAERELQRWARARIYFLLGRQPGDCLNELRDIACWIRDEHSHWLLHDWFWDEYVRINCRADA